MTDVVNRGVMVLMTAFALVAVVGAVDQLRLVNGDASTQEGTIAAEDPSALGRLQGPDVAPAGLDGTAGDADGRSIGEDEGRGPAKGRDRDDGHPGQGRDKERHGDDRDDQDGGRDQEDDDDGDDDNQGDDGDGGDESDEGPDGDDDRDEGGG